MKYVSAGLLAIFYVNMFFLPIDVLLLFKCEALFLQTNYLVQLIMIQQKYEISMPFDRILVSKIIGVGSKIIAVKADLMLIITFNYWPLRFFVISILVFFG